MPRRRSGRCAGIGGCVEQNLAAQFAATTPTYFYQFDDEDAPAQNNDLPGFVWGAAHGGELGFLWPSFAPYGIDLYDLLTPAELRMSGQMIAWWGAFAWRRHCAPGAPASRTPGP
jgi:carboxylesterase type B